jgi:hypothetical protein
MPAAFVSGTLSCLASTLGTAFKWRPVAGTGDLMLVRVCAVVLLLVCAFPQFTDAQTSTPASKDKLDRLIVSGDGFAFGVKEPDQWSADTGELARKYHVNIVFAPGNAGQAKDVTIRVRLNSKVDENTIEDLIYDMSQYKKEYPKAEFKDLSVTHPEYKTFAKLVYVPHQFYEYVAYVNPDPVSKFTFSVAMSKKSEPATPDEVKAFESVLKSLVCLSAGTGQK